MDQLDKKILGIVQRDNQRSHASIGEEVGLSPSAVRRRLTALRQDGTIERDVAILKPSGLGVRLIVTVTFGKETPEIYDAFDRQMAALPEVMQSYHVAGHQDYVLIIQGPSTDWYEIWAKEVLMANDAIARYDTMVVWSCKKFETAQVV